MNKKEKLETIKQRFKELDPEDPELAHNQADNLLLQALRLCNQHEIVDAYEQLQEEIPWWVTA